MLITVHTEIIIDVKDMEQAEEACHALNTGLENQLRNFPEGEVIATEVDHYEKVPDAEAKERGWLE